MGLFIQIFRINLVINFMFFFYQELNADRAQLTPFQQRLIDWYLIEARLNGIEMYNKENKLFKGHLTERFEKESKFQ